jgi:hypothetical protein
MCWLGDSSTMRVGNMGCFNWLGEEEITLSGCPLEQARAVPSGAAAYPARFGSSTFFASALRTIISLSLA